MKQILGLLANHWLAKLLSLVLAVTLWAVVRKNVAATNSPSRFQFEVSTDPAPTSDKFQIDTRANEQRKK